MDGSKLDALLFLLASLSIVTGLLVSIVMLVFERLGAML